MRLRIVQAVLGTVGGLLIVPFAVNLATGGTAPLRLQPYAGWVWPAAITCVVATIALQIWIGRDGRSPSRQADDPRNFGLALQQVDRYVTSRRRGSMAEKVRLALALDERPDAVRQPAHLVQRVNGTDFQLSDELTIVDVFDDMIGSVLILGDPGSGKTTQLLDLAAGLVERGRADGEHIPVVVDLADWSRSGLLRLPGSGSEERAPRDFTAWLFDVLRTRYRFPVPVSSAWLEQNRLVLLLDGLDEVRASDRERCISEINELQRRFAGLRLAVCSRVADYDRLTGRLQMQGAVVIRPLTQRQVAKYLADTSPGSADVVAALESDPRLVELLTSPLMLSIVAWAYEDRRWREIAHDRSPTGHERIFDAYVVEVLARRRGRPKLDDWRSLVALRMLAVAATRMNSGVRVPPLTYGQTREVMDRRILFAGRVWISYSGVTVCCASAGAVTGLVAGPQGALLAGLGSWLMAWALLSVLFALDGLGTWNPDLWWGRPAGIPGPRFLLLVAWLVTVSTATAASFGLLYSAAIQTAGMPRLGMVGVVLVVAAAEILLIWGSRFVDEEDAASRLSVWVTGGAMAIAAVVAIFGVPTPAIIGWVAGVVATVAAATCMVHSWITFHGPYPSPVKWQAPLLTVLVAAASLSVSGPAGQPFWPFAYGWLAGVATGVVPGLGAGYLLEGWYAKLAIAMAGFPVPWRRRFLRFAADRSFLVQAEGEYRFVHLLIRDHLATCDPATLAEAVRRRRVEAQTTSSHRDR